MLSAVKKSKNIKVRTNMHMNSVQMNNFLFKRTRRIQTEQPQHLQTQDQNQKTLRVRLRSQISPESSAQHTKSFKSILRGHIGAVHANRETFANVNRKILKWNNMKSKYENKNQLNFNNSSIRRRNSQVYTNINKIKGGSMKINFGTNNYSEYTPGNKSLNLNQISNKNKQVRKSYEQTQKIIQNYRFTQRIVYLEQLQQRRDKQFQIQYVSKKSKVSRLVPIQKQNQQDYRQGAGTGSRMNTLCRPWSGRSTNSLNKDKQ